MIKTYTYKIYKNKSIEQKFDEWINICRFVYNIAKETKDYAYQAGINIRAYGLSNQLTQCKRTKEFSFINKVGANTLQGIIERLDLGYNRFFTNLKKKIKASPPKWAKKNRFKSFGFKIGVKQIDKGFQLPKFGKVKVHNNRKIDGKIKTARLIKKADGLYLNVTAEVEDKKYCFNENQVGIDLGIKYFMVTSDGEFVDNPRFLEKQLKKLRIEQRKLARQKQGSNRWRKQVNVLARLHKKVTDARQDFLHKQSTYIASMYSNVVVENLEITKMVKSRLARHISDVAWGRFIEMLSYKVNNLFKINPAYTSQECSKCSHTCKENRVTQSHFKCVSCGHEDNADLDAAKVILGRVFPNSRERESLDCALAVDFLTLKSIPRWA